jgi:hypothetical protein
VFLLSHFDENLDIFHETEFEIGDDFVRHGFEKLILPLIYTGHFLSEHIIFTKAILKNNQD